MTEAAKFGDPVIGVDLHMVMVPTPAGPVPTPLPHPFVGVVFDPLGAAIGAAISAVFGGGGPVFVNGMPVGNTGIEAKGVPHIPTPPGVSFAPNDIPDNSGTIVTGSKTVHMAGSSEGRMTSMVSTCNFPLNLPTSVCMAVPMGAPVIVGGPTALDVFAAVTRAIRTKWFSDLLHSILKPGRFLSKVICFLTGHPVDVMSGQLIADAVDFSLPGPIPLVFERNYYSRDPAEGPLGPGWHHPLAAELREEGTLVRLRLPDGREVVRDAPAKGAPAWDDIDRFTLTRTDRGYRLTFWDGRAYHFEPVPGAAASHPLVRITDRCENRVELRYDRGRLREVTDSVGRLLELETAGGRLRSIRLRRGKEPWVDLVRYEYDAEGRLSAAVDPLGHATRYAYRGGVMVKETNRNGLSFYFEYDAYEPEGWCVRTWGDGGIYDRRIKYDKIRHFTVVDDSRGGRTMYYGNEAGLVEREVDPTGREKRYEWDACCRKTAEVDGLGNRTEWEYDAWGNKILERDALGQETRWRYDEMCLPVEMVDAAGGAWRREYDRRGKLVVAVDPLGNATLFEHDRRSNLTRIEDPLRRAIVMRYDEAGELVALIDREGREVHYEVDARGSLVRRTDGRGGEMLVARDACGRVVEIRRPDGSVVRFSRDAEGQLAQYVDGLGNTSSFRFGGVRKLMERVDPSGGVVRYAYDSEENLVRVTNEAGEEHALEYDLAGRLVRERGFDGRTLEYTYDRAGRCVEVVDARERRTRLERDALGRVVKRVVPRGPATGDPIPEPEVMEYTYDALGGVVSAKSGAVEVTLERDAMGRVIEERTGAHAIESLYDAAGHRVGRRTSLGHDVGYEVDGNGDLLSMAMGQDPRFGDFSPGALSAGGSTRPTWRATWKRDAAGGELERQLPGEVVSRWERDVSGRPRLHRVAHRDVQLLGVGYQWRSEEQLAALVDTQAGPTRFHHDARAHLVAATGPDGRVQYRAPDAVGNLYRTADRTDREYDKGGALRSADGARYAYDEDGQLVEKVTADGQRWRYAWDHVGQLREVVRPDGQTVSFAYDAFGRRVKKTFAGCTTTYVWSGNDLVHEVKEGAPCVAWEIEPGRFAPVAKVEGDRRYAVITDHLGTPRMLVDEAGEIAWRAQVDLYGVAKADVMKTGCPWRWPGQYEDEETGLVYNRFRYYDPEAGRYVSQDPAGLAGGLRAYAYVKDPNTWADPFGLAGACGTPGQQLEQDVENALNNAGIPILKRNEEVLDATGKVAGEIDFEVQQAIIETTVSPSGKLGQLQKYQSALFNPTGKPVIIFAPNYSGGATQAIENSGGMVVKNLSDLTSLVK